MSGSTRATVAEPQAKTEKARAESKTPDARQHATGLEAQILHRQKTIGNRAVQRLIKSGSLQGPAKPVSSRRNTPEPPTNDLSSRAMEPQTSEPGPLGASRAGTPEFQIPRPTAPRESTSGPAVQKQAIRPTQSAVPNQVHRHWYNVSIGGYEFDPSWSGVKTAAGLVKDAAVGAFDWIVDKIKELVSEAWDWLTEKWHDLEDLVGSALKSVESALGAIVRFLLRPLGALADAIMSFDSQAVDSAWKVLSGVITWVSNGFKATIDAILAPVNALWGLIDKFAGSTIDTISSLFDKLPGVLQKVAQPVIDKIKSLWKSVNDWWTENFNKLKAWADSAVDKVFNFVRRILAFGINVVVQSILQFGKLVLFIKDFVADPKKYIVILAKKSLKAFDGLENKFGGLIHQYFGSSSKAQAAPATSTKVQRQPDKAAPADAKTSATWSKVGEGVWDMMKKKWNEFKSNPLSIVLSFLMDLLLPVVGNVRDIIKLFQDIKKIVTGPLSAGSLEELWTSILQILDIPILIYQTVVSILMRSLMLPLFISTFIPHPVVEAIAAAVGEALLGAFVEAEVLNIAHKLLLLKTGATTKSQKEDAYNRVADSLIAGAMAIVAAIIELIIHFIANVVKSIFNFIKGKVFRVETRAVGGEGRSTAKPADSSGGKGQGPERPEPESSKTEPDPRPEYDPKSKSDLDLNLDTDPAPRNGETVEQAEARAKSAREELDRRGAMAMCFVAGTLVQTPGGPVPIENISKGQMVLARNGSSDIGEYQTLQSVRGFTRTLYHVEIASTFTLTTTRNHPFFVFEKGWTDAKDLVVGAQLVAISGETVPVTAVRRERLLDPVQTFNIHVESASTYFVGCGPFVWVHNADPKDPVFTGRLFWGLGASGPRQRGLDPPNPALDPDGASSWESRSTEQVGKIMGVRAADPKGKGNMGAVSEQQLASKGLVAVETPGEGPLAEVSQHHSIRPADSPDPNVPLTDEQKKFVKEKLEAIEKEGVAAKAKPKDFGCA